MASKPRVGSCLECGIGITAHAVKRTGRCWPCGIKLRNADPEFQARRVAAIKRKWAEPDYRQKMMASAKEVGRRNAANPEFVAMARELGKRNVHNLFRPDVRERTLRGVRERAGKTISDRAWAWCPQEYREQALYLLRTKRLPLAETKAAIADQIKADLARLSPFERQERALQRGAALIANDRAPMFGEALKVVGE